MYSSCKQLFVSLCLCVFVFHPALQAQDGAYLFKTYCAICHEAANVPGRDVLRQRTPEHILQVLETGSMKAQAAERSRAQRRVLAEYLSEKRFASPPGDVIPRSAFCG